VEYFDFFVLLFNHFVQYGITDYITAFSKLYWSPFQVVRALFSVWFLAAVKAG